MCDVGRKGNPIGKSLQSDIKSGNSFSSSGNSFSSEHQRKLRQSSQSSSAMLTHTNLCLLAAAMLVTALCASAAPLAHAHTVSPPGEETGVVLSSWELALEALRHHREEFEEEFQGNIEYTSLDKYNHSSFPVNSPNSSFSKEAFLQRLTQGMHIYMVLLKHVEKEYPHWSFLTTVKNSLHRLITLIKGKMRNSHRVTVPTSSQVSQMLSDLRNTDDFHRKMQGHSVLYYLRNFLVDGKRAFKKWNMPKQCTNRTQTS